MSLQEPRKNLIEGYKYCPKCDCYKPVGAFFASSLRGDGRQPYCKPCTATIHDKRAEMLVSNYGITRQDYDRMYEEQDGKCAICGGPPVARRSGSTAVFHVDHNHTTGAVRGLLCARCNLLVGVIERGLPEMQPRIQNRALEYLAKGSCSVWGEAIENARPDQDVVQRFLTDCCVFQNTSEIRALVLYNAFLHWCEEEGEVVRSQMRFGIVLAQKGYQKRRSSGIRWIGIALKEPNGTSSRIRA